MKNKLNKKIFLIVLFILILFYFLTTGIYNQIKPMQKGTSVEGEIYSIDENSIEFLYDLTYLNETGERVYEQVIFNRVFEIIENASSFILIDMFLWGSGQESYRNLSQEIADSLILKKQENPNITINLITDEFNSVYGSSLEPTLKQIKDAGINVVFTDMNKMRDSNPFYSSIWRVLFFDFGIPTENCEFSLISFGGKKVCIRSGLKLLNFKANHRKLIVADSGDKRVSFVTSANPHGGSSAHSNVAFYFEEKIWRDIYESEKAIASFSGEFIDINFKSISEKNSSDVLVQFLSEGQISKGLIDEIDNTLEGESVEILMFYFSDRDVVNSLIRASNRGVNISLILDPNKDAFGMEKNGIPNRPVAEELIKKSNGLIKVRWYDTHGEQFHTKMIIIRKNNSKTIIFLGSANLTKRNIQNYNLEADVKLIANSDSNVVQEIYFYFNRIWFNEGGTYSAEYEKYKDDSWFRFLIYLIQEKTGLSTF